MNLPDGLAILKSGPCSPYSRGILRLGLLGLLSALLFLIPGESRDLSPLAFVSGLAPIETVTSLVSLSDTSLSRTSLTSPPRELSTNRSVFLIRRPLRPMGLEASFVEAALPASNYPDLFCLHADLGSEPLLECHHDDSPISSPGTSPPFLANELSTPEQRIPTRGVLDSPAPGIFLTDLASPTPPPRTSFV